MRSWKVLDLWGIPFRIHSNWVVIFFLFSWSISTQVNQTSSAIYSLKESFRKTWPNLRWINYKLDKNEREIIEDLSQNNFRTGIHL